PMGIILLMVMLWSGFYFFQKKLVLATLQISQSEERYRSLVEGSPNGIVLFDPDGRCQAMNRKGLAMLGLRATQVLNRPLVEHLPPQQQSRLQGAFDQVRAGQAVGLEVELDTPEGHNRCWQVVFNPLRGNRGEVQGSVGIFSDITEQKQAEQALRTSRALLQSLLEAIPDLLVVVDRNYRIIYSNNQKQCSLAAAPGAACPTCYQTFHNRQTPCENCPVQEVFRTGRIVEREEANERFPGIYEIRAFPVYGNNGQVDLVIEHIRNITARKEVEEALRTREAKLQSIFRATPVGIGVVENRVLQEVNERVCQLTGYSQEELVGQNARLLYPSQNEYDFVGQEKYRQIAAKGVGTVETVWRRKDGQIIEVLLSSAPLFPGTASSEVLFTVMDISEQKKLEALRATVAKMESLGIMAGGIAHDFNNVLMAILGNISLLGMASTPAEIREGLQEAEQACRQAMLLAKQLQTFAKGGAPVKKAGDLRVLMEESARLALSGSKVKIEYVWPTDLWQIQVDAGQMHQVFTNLLINADQAMPGGGQIRITAENCPIGPSSPLPLRPGKYVRCQISDQGVGIAQEHLDKIFDPYFTTKQKGSGLGLTMVYSIIKQHGGVITVTSQLGQGTTFFIYLPAAARIVDQAATDGETLVPGHGRILVLEDEPGVRTIMGKMLAKLGYEPVFGQEGREILDLYTTACRQHQNFAAVILDLTIPGGMGGLETCQKLREQDPQVRAIVSSGYADDPVLADYHAYGFVAALAKPYRLNELSQVLHQVLG
ncbi:MAG: PAS domain-containing hybrid sensor histidine kinase/response regulator, partial [Desulfobacca sp.]|uniref:PAS domain-containing hybrid sensor histidine kinase/response regulator n=1 Tax=Desulfobacca sp. TaxID=2067990 RepID=UPI004049739D